MDFPVELVELLKHADVECKLIWIKAEKPIDTIGEVASQAIKMNYVTSLFDCVCKLCMFKDYTV
jgi:hypothetical protein